MMSNVSDLRIDGDAIANIAGHAADSRGGDVSHSLYNTKIVMQEIIDRFTPCHVQTFLTSKKKEHNFRYSIFPAYKSNRNRCTGCKKYNLKSVDTIGTNELGGIFTQRICQDCGKLNRGSKPVFYSEIRAYLINRFGAKICQWGEADDWLGAGATKDTIIASHDKDLLMIPCKHWRLRQKQGLIVTDPGLFALNKDRKLKGTGLKWFVAQLLLGDTSDGIPGAIPKFSDVKIYERLKDLSPKDMYKLARHTFISTNEGYSAISTNWEIRCRLFWISRQPREIFTEELFYNYCEEAR